MSYIKEDTKENDKFEILTIDYETSDRDSITSTTKLIMKDEEDKKSTSKDAFINLYKGCIGSGILASPYTFYQGGYILSLLIYLSIPVLMYLSQKVRRWRHTLLDAAKDQ